MDKQQLDENKGSPSMSTSTTTINNKSNWNYAISGFLSGCATRFICQPLDVLKIRFQLQIEPISRSSSISKYRSLMQTFSTIIREESIGGLWKGHVSAQILSGIYGMAYFSTFEILTNLTFKWLIEDNQRTTYVKQQSQPLIHFLCGSLSGLNATLLSHPFDVIRTRIISQSESKTYFTTRQAFMSILRNEGTVGLYRGFLPTIIQIMPYSGVQFATYNIFKMYWKKYFNNCDNFKINIFEDKNIITIQSSFICGAISGMLAKFLVYPLDLIKKRLQIRGFELNRGDHFGKTIYYKGFIHCIVHIIRTENISAFYKGMTPSILKSTLSTALHFWLYELFIKKLNNDLSNHLP